MLRQQYQPDVYESVHRDIIVKLTNKMQLVNGKANPFTGLDRPTGFQEVEVPRF
jgi:hypothetical protein